MTGKRHNPAECWCGIDHSYRPPVQSGMDVCPRHNRWTEIRRADGSAARRDCPECPERRGALIVNQFTGEPVLDERDRKVRVAIPLEADRD